MKRRLLLTAAPAAVLSGCGPMTALGEATGVLNADDSVSLYGIAKGMAEIAMIADPGLGLVVNGILAVAEPLLADVQKASSTADASAQALAAQANRLQLATAGVVTVTPNLGAPA